MPSAIDLFCGCGGLSLGIQRAGFSVERAVDSWAPAVRTYGQNFAHDAQLARISESTTLPSSDIIVGGPPCQGFSSAGLRKLDDNRNSLVATFAAIVAQHKPRAFVFENVEGFITAGSGSYLADLLDPVIQAGYRVHLRKVNAADYGAPQHRKRVIAIGGLGWNPSFPEATHRSFGAPGTGASRFSLPLSPTISDAWAGLPPASVSGERDSAIDGHDYVPFSASYLARAEALKQGQTMRDLPEHLWHESFRKRAFRRVQDGTPTERRGGAPAGLKRLVAAQPSKAITGGALREFVHPTEHRPLTIRECARIQGFPDEFAFSGNRAEQIQQIGNAVPVQLAQSVAMSLFRDLSLNESHYDREGALLSFVPTESEGMSPILQRVTQHVASTYDVQPRSQLQLWP